MTAGQPSRGGSRPVPIGSRSIGVSLQPAIPRRVAPQQSPLPLHQSPTIVPQTPLRRGNQKARLNLTARIQSRAPASCPSPRGCHLYFAHSVSFLSCADTQCRRQIKMPPLCQLERRSPEVCGGKVVWRTSDDELSRLEERTTREAV